MPDGGACLDSQPPFVSLLKKIYYQKDPKSVSCLVIDGPVPLGCGQQGPWRFFPEDGRWSRPCGRPSGLCPSRALAEGDSVPPGHSPVAPGRPGRGLREDSHAWLE